tara:strand:- start:522 stop:818 length:297 start_codon:yes stop_codon:yes gene_type:complete
MSKKIQKKIEELLFEVYEKGLQQETTDLTAYYEKIEQALNIPVVSNSWLSPIDSEKEWQEKHIKKIWQGYPNICPNWQILNGLIRFSCENLDIEVTEP